MGERVSQYVDIYLGVGERGGNKKRKARSGGGQRFKKIRFFNDYASSIIALEL